MTPDAWLAHDCLLLGTLLFAIGLVGFLTRRDPPSVLAAAAQMFLADALILLGAGALFQAPAAHVWALAGLAIGAVQLLLVAALALASSAGK